MAKTHRRKNIYKATVRRVFVVREVHELTREEIVSTVTRKQVSPSSSHVVRSPVIDKAAKAVRIGCVRLPDDRHSGIHFQVFHALSEPSGTAIVVARRWRRLLSERRQLLLLLLLWNSLRRQQWLNVIGYRVRQKRRRRIRRNQMGDVRRRDVRRRKRRH